MGRANELCVWAIVAGTVVGIGPAAVANVTFQSQQRSISVATTSNGGSQIASAPSFAPFVQNLVLSTTFPGADGPTPNVSAGRIDCQIDPNAIRASGFCGGSGGVRASTGEPEVGECNVSILVTFVVDTPTAFNLVAAPRPALRPTDEFKLELKDQTRHDQLVYLSELDAPRQVGTSGTLQPGTYSMRYKVEGTFDGAEMSRDFSFNLTLGCRADFNGVNGATNQDIFDYLSAWFAGESRADFNGVSGLDVQDVFDFLGAWFTGCV